MGNRGAGQTAVSIPFFNASNSEASQPQPAESQGVGRSCGSTGDLGVERAIQSPRSTNLEGTNTGGNSTDRMTSDREMDSRATDSKDTDSNARDAQLDRTDAGTVDLGQEADDTGWAYVGLTQSEPESISNALARNPPTIQLADGTFTVASVGALKQLVEHLNRERIKVQELMSSLSFALRSFNNVNQILELIPLVSSRIADASGAALVLFEGTGDIKISRMYCSDGGDCSRIQQALERAVQSVASELSDSSSGDPSGKVPPKSAYSTDDPASTSIKLADSFERLLDERVGLNLGSNVQLFGTSLLSRNVIRGRLYVFSHRPDYIWDAERQKLIRLVLTVLTLGINPD